ncbi:MAG: hypothetical protein GXP08_02280 [Gammaproteobacteria bacterium]|nr:hypothetical protein [Gammaproteobacteria bacterium]
MEPIRLSDALVMELQKVMIKYDQRAEDDGIAAQYFAAVIGYSLSQQSFSSNQKKEFLNQLFEFSNHVLLDCEPDQSSMPEQQVAMGKWCPGDA